jgi:hypothetical protein
VSDETRESDGEEVEKESDARDRKHRKFRSGDSSSVLKPRAFGWRLRGGGLVDDSILKYYLL